VAVLMNAGLAFLIFAVLYLASRGCDLWGVRRFRRGNREAASAVTEQGAAAGDSRVKSAKFGARFAGGRKREEQEMAPNGPSRVASAQIAANDVHSK